MVGLGERENRSSHQELRSRWTPSGVSMTLFSSRREGRPTWQSEQKAKKANKKNPSKEQYDRGCGLILPPAQINMPLQDTKPLHSERAGSKPGPALSWQGSSICYLVSILPSESRLYK